jgi:hypothetical protein
MVSPPVGAVVLQDECSLLPLARQSLIHDVPGCPPPFVPFASCGVSSFVVLLACKNEGLKRSVNRGRRDAWSNERCLTKN